MEPRTARERSTAARRRQIIEAALACFTEVGFSETTMDHIRRRSRASTGSIYHHFQSKEQLAAEVYLEGIMDYQRGVLEQLAANRGPREGVVAMVQYHLRWVAEHPDWARYLHRMRQAEFLGPTLGRFQALNEAFVEQVGRWFAPHIRTGHIRRLPQDLTVALLLGPSQEFSRLLLTGRTTTDLDTASQTLAEATWRALSAPPQGS